MFSTVVSIVSFPTANQMIPVVLFEKTGLHSLLHRPLMKYKSSWAGQSDPGLQQCTGSDNWFAGAFLRRSETQPQEQTGLLQRWKMIKFNYLWWNKLGHTLWLNVTDLPVNNWSIFMPSILLSAISRHIKKKGNGGIIWNTKWQILITGQIPQRVDVTVEKWQSRSLTNYLKEKGGLRRLSFL